MKKIFSKEIFLLPFFILTLFVWVNKVNALDDRYISNYYDFYPFYNSLDTSIPSALVDFYNNNLSTNYPYYIIFYDSSFNYLYLSATKCNTLYVTNDNYFLQNCGVNNLSVDIHYDFNTSTYDYNASYHIGLVTFLPYSTSSDYIFVGPSSCVAYQPNNNCYSSLTLPSYSNMATGVILPQYIINDNYVIPTYTTLKTGSYVAGPSGTEGTSGLTISDLFTNPIQALQSVWSTIVSFFNIITQFLLLIPSPLKEFLISAFMLAIILGIVKIVIG